MEGLRSPKGYRRSDRDRSLPVSVRSSELSYWLTNNMLAKYQMIILIDFCEVWFLPESVARVASIDFRSPLPHASALIQRDFGCVCSWSTADQATFSRCQS
ncbi:hypothetical protein TNCV_571901 [Trichonephila clavipes]|nr:hypothetical protein TNCV_571901 [Trichonephila clavipes]